MKKNYKKLVAMQLVSVLLFLFVASAHANDSTARVATGGISFIKSEDIRMKQEILEISTNAIRVRYRFINEKGADIQATVAFPMPAYGWNAGESGSDTHMHPLRPFSTLVNGHFVSTAIDRRAMIGGRDITNALRKIGLNDLQIFETFAHCSDDGTEKKFELCGLTKIQVESVKQLGDWTVHETALWEHVFPAYKEIEVLHEYSPLVGSSYSIPYQKGFGYISGMLVNPNSSEACVDEGIQKAIKKRIELLVNRGAKGVGVVLEEVEYILGTGRNWKGAISDFKLRIVKKSPDQLVSLCFPGKPKRVGQTMLEFSQNDFIPQDRLVIYFYTVKELD